MKTEQAFAMGDANRHNPSMVFDWDKAAKMILLSGAKYAAAGLSGDWEWTGGDILRNGKPVPRSESYTYLASTWAVPQIRMAVSEDAMLYGAYTEAECWLWVDDMPPDWKENMKSGLGGGPAGIRWPESALQILLGPKQIEGGTE